MKLITDITYHGHKKEGKFFEGWYLKHIIDNKVYAFIPGISIEKDGEKSAFIQIIYDTTSHILFFEEKDFKVDSKDFIVEIGDNIFSNKGITLNINRPEEGVVIQGNIKYGQLNSLPRTKYMPSIMGPYSYCNFLECYHGLISLNHNLSGELIFNNESISFDGGKGYIEKDWGTSFPKAWIWVQSNVFSQSDISFFLSIADIPFLGFEFLGLISILRINGKTYPIATYLGGKVTGIKRDEGTLEIEIKQRKLNLKVSIKEKNGHHLLAPVKGAMNRPIKETISADIHVCLKEGDKVIFSEKGTCAGLETVGNVRGFSY